MNKGLEGVTADIRDLYWRARTSRYGTRAGSNTAPAPGVTPTGDRAARAAPRAAAPPFSEMPKRGSAVAASPSGDKRTSYERASNTVQRKPRPLWRVEWRRDRGGAPKRSDDCVRASPDESRQLRGAAAVRALAGAPARAAEREANLLVLRPLKSVSASFTNFSPANRAFSGVAVGGRRAPLATPDSVALISGEAAPAPL
jgi:hypothetical protein